MAEYTYIRTKLLTGEYDVDTSYGPNRLINEIYTALPTQQNVKTISNGTQLKVITENILSIGDETILNNTVATHISNNTAAIIPTPYKINGTFDSPLEKNINLYGLHRKDTIDSLGSLTVKEYYKTYDGTTYSDLVVKDEYIYTINSTTDLVDYRDETITWYREDTTIGITKSIKKYYDLNNAIKEGMARRTNLVDKTKAYGLSTITGTHASGIPNAHYYFNLLYTNIQMYVSGIDKTLLIDQINNTDINVEIYMTQTIKDTMVGILDYWT